MPPTEGSSRLRSALSLLSWCTFSLLSPTSHGGPPLWARAPVRFAFLRENHPKSLDAPPSPLCYCIHSSLAWLAGSALANLATVRLPHPANPQALPRAYAAQYDRGDGVSSKRNLIHTPDALFPFVPCVPNGPVVAATVTLLPPGRTSSLYPAPALYFLLRCPRFH